MTHEHFDIAVIGGGIAGTSIAAELAATHHVIVLEREEFPGYHSTGRSAALFSEIYGNAVVRALSRASRDFFFSPPAGFVSQPLVKSRGALYIASDAQIASLERFMQGDGVAGAVRRLTQQKALDLCPVLRPERVTCAVLEDDAADVDVAALHEGYLRLFRILDGTLRTNAEVRSLQRVGATWRIETGAGTVHARTVVNAAGAWADTIAGLAGAQPLAIQPCRRTALLAELPAGIQAQNWPMIIDIDESFYLKPDAGLLLLSPADETPVGPGDVQPEELDVAIAIDRVERATTLTIRRIVKKWAGLRSFAPSRSPVVGFDRSVRDFFWFAGQGGYGIQTAPALSKLAAALVRAEPPPAEIGGRELIAALSPQQFSLAASARNIA